MKRALLASLLTLALNFGMMADTYKIKLLNTQSIEIGGSKKRVGGTFDDAAVISWSSSTQIMEVENASNHEQKVFSSLSFKSKGVKTVKDYLGKINRGTTRDVNVDMTLTAGVAKDKFPEKRVALIIANTNYEHLSAAQPGVRWHRAHNKTV